MLKKLFFLFISLSFLKINAQNEKVFNYKFTYKLTYQVNNKDINSKRSENMLLLRNNKFSVFLSEGTFIDDSLSLRQRKNEISYDVKAPKTRFFYKILKDDNRDSITVYNEIFMDNYKYKEGKNKIRWKVTSDTSVINGLKCQKATTTFSGRFYEAWFTNEIPISDGPYKFSGLPGLIIKISDSKNHYVFELTKQSNVNRSYPNLKPIKNLYLTKKSIFFKKQKEFKDNIVTKMSQSGFTLDKKHEKRVKERQKRRNNPIELDEPWYLKQ